MTVLWLLEGQQHDIQPHLESGLTREVDGSPLLPPKLTEWDVYPVLAVCRTCRDPIRAASMYSDWVHWPAG